MNFSISQEQKMLQDAFREFAKTEVAPNAAKWTKKMFVPLNFFLSLGSLGCWEYLYRKSGAELVLAM